MILGPGGPRLLRSAPIPPGAAGHPLVSGRAPRQVRGTRLAADHPRHARVEQSGHRGTGSRDGPGLSHSRGQGTALHRANGQRLWGIESNVLPCAPPAGARRPADSRAGATDAPDPQPAPAVPTVLEMDEMLEEQPAVQAEEPRPVDLPAHAEFTQLNWALRSHRPLLAALELTSAWDSS